MRWALSLRTRIVLSFCLLLAATSAAVLGLFNRMVADQLHRAVVESTKRAGSLVAPAVVDRMDQISRVTTLMAAGPGAKSIIQADGPSTDDYARDIVNDMGVDWVAISDGKGQLKGSSGQDAGLDMTPLGVHEALDGQEWTGATTLHGKLVIAATRPVRVGNYVHAALTSAVEIDHKLAGDVARSSGVELALRYQGRLAGATFSGVLPSPKDGVYEMELNGRSFIGSSTMLELKGLKGPVEVVVFIPRDQVTAPFAALSQGVVVSFVLAIAVALLLGISLSRHVTGPIDRLVTAARRVEKGEWVEPIAIPRADELGLLMKVFDRMILTLRENNERLMAMLDVDPLTQLYNHRSFREKLEAAVADSRDEGTPLALILIDLDEFDDYNRRNGGADGDRVLTQVADILRGETSCLAARTAGDEFTLICHQDCAARAESLRQRIAQIGVTASIGVAAYSEQTHRSDLLVLAATLAKDQAKHAGRNRVREFTTFAIHGAEGDLRPFLQQGSYAAVRALAEAVDAKDEYTRGHSQRVAQYAKSIAEAIGEDKGFVDLVYVSGTLHDVGKIGVPDHVLKKEGRLTDEELAAIRKHPELGEKIVAQIPQLKDALPGVRWHHERWDGKGYPDGLAGEDIPLLARILAIADTYDAMTSDRPYRKGMPEQVAVDEIVRNAGAQFDPSLIEGFLNSVGRRWRRAA